MSVNEERYVSRRPSFVMQFLGVIAVLTAFVVIGYWAKIAIDTKALVPPTILAQPTITVPTVAAPVVAPPIAPPAVVPTAYIPVEQQVQYQPLPPAEVPIEDVQPRTEVVQVDRGETSTTIIRTVPVNPSGPPVVVDKGEKRRGAPRP